MSEASQLPSEPLNETPIETPIEPLAIPNPSLVVLVGVTGSGKSTFARRHFLPTQVLSSDFCRGLVADDENDQSATADAFDVLNFIAARRLTAGRLTVVDATNVQRTSRARLVELARAHDVLPVAIVLDVPESVCVARNADRPDRAFGAHVVRRQHGELRRSLRGLAREGFRRVHVLRSEAEIAAATIEYTPLLNDRRELTGPFDVIGDVHGCRDELEALLTRLGYQLRRDDEGRAVGGTHSEGRRVIFLGDLVDRGPDTPGVLRLAMGMVAAGEAFAVPGNHENKLVRALRGRQVRIGHGLAESLAQLGRETPEFRTEVERFCDGLVSHLVLDGGRLVVAHAGLKEAYQGRASGRVRSFALYGDTTGESDEYGLPVRYPWARDYRGKAMVLYGHTPVPEPRWENNTLCLDTGCVFGGRLTALRYPERELVSVPAAREYFEPRRPLAEDPAEHPAEQPAERPAEGPATRPEEAPASVGDGAVDPPAVGASGTGAATLIIDTGASGDGTTGPTARPDTLHVNDVLGRRFVETRHGGRVRIEEQNALAALEVMSRFAVDPRWLVYLPPTMSPPPTTTLPGLLEHPVEAFEAYRADGVEDLLCEQKHMGSRAVVVVCRDAATARGRFGAPDGVTGAVYTRTGRPFLAPDLTEALLARLRAAMTTSGLWDELAAGWAVFDGEIMPWSAKAHALIRRQYAATGAAARAVLPVAVDALARAVGRGVDVADLLERTRGRAANADAFTAAYQPYCWPVDGLAGLRFAPFMLLAAGGAPPTSHAGPAAGVGAHAGDGQTATTYLDRDNLWHLAVADRLAAADPDLLATTARIRVDPADPESVAAGTRWWEELTAAGGEGMVVKPFAGLARGKRGLALAGVKVRGREYLRIIYGGDYTEAVHLDRLRERGLGRKRSLAFREYALGLEALERTAAGEPLWRVHECVFAVLALESEPVDPRL
ncbi:polynucleotide kinase-phosphatase [Frankia sp. CcI49]|uniref:polynucleotide kinase-phosphatase n=1 Tax=Frankia sp. CcI49 TaxID=1745382 RepID=UPI0009785BC8|nr:polynucleotide kinase-phosphatase [Frankia sp. CcI49]